MKNTLKLDHENGLIVMDRTFAQKAENTMSTEYAHLQNVRRDYPTYQVIRREIKKNPNTEHYKGLYASCFFFAIIFLSSAYWI